jgi:hypothetical protein
VEVSVKRWLTKFFMRRTNLHKSSLLSILNRLFAFLMKCHSSKLHFRQCQPAKRVTKKKCFPYSIFIRRANVHTCPPRVDTCLCVTLCAVDPRAERLFGTHFLQVCWCRALPQIFGRQDQGDQIWRILLPWAIVFYEHFFKLQMQHTNIGRPFPRLRLWIHFAKRCVGLHFGWFFHKRIWSPWTGWMGLGSESCLFLLSDVSYHTF